MNSRKGTFCKVAMIVISLTFAFALAPSAMADVMYSYLGEDFTSFTNATNPPYSKITGSFTIPEAIQPGSEYKDLSALISFSLTDGVNSWTSENGSLVKAFRFNTDANGTIVDWGFVATNQQNSANYFIMTAFSGLDKVDQSNARIINTGGVVFSVVNFNAPGKWTMATVPEPATILLLGFGLIGLAGARRKFKK